MQQLIMKKPYTNPRKPERENKQVTVGKITDLPPGRSATVELNNGAELALFNIAGKFYAIENFCPHKGIPLADGFARNGTVECNRHGWKFDLETGECYEKSSCSIEAYEVTIEDEMIKILV